MRRSRVLVGVAIGVVALLVVYVANWYFLCNDCGPEALLDPVEFVRGLLASF